jgi:O-antigen/teichoic acid export membrane protein
MDTLKKKAVSGLKWLEKYTKTDMMYLAKGGFWLGLGQFVSSGSAFLMSVAFANLLSPESYGLYKFVLSINALILITTLAGMDSAITQAVARGYEGTLDVGVKAKMRWGLLGTLISFCVAAYYYAQGNMILTICFAIVGLFAPFTESLDAYNSLLWGKKLFSVQAKYNVINIVVILVTTTTTLFLTKNLYIILLAYFLALTIPNIFFLKRTRQLYKENDAVDPAATKYGKHLSVMYVISLVLAQLDKVLVFHYVGAADLAVYSLAVAPTDQIKGLLKNVNSLAIPKFSERTATDIKKNVWHKIWILMLGVSVLVCAYILLTPLFFHIFFPKYVASIRYSQALALSIIPVVVAGFLYTILESQKATKELYQYNIYSNIVNIIILFPLVYYYGIWGAIITRIVSRTFSFVVSGFLINNLP